LNIEIKPPEQFQQEDLDFLINADTQLKGGTANWSEMGAKKTSTGLWFIQRKMESEGIKNPKVLIITTRSGKGTYFQLAPGLLKGWTIFNIGTQRVNVLLNGIELKLPLETIGTEYTMPILAVTHYNVFTKSNQGVPETDEEGYPRTDDNGKIIFKPLQQADYLIQVKWDFVILDEAHRIKNRKGKWVKNIKKLDSKHKHIMTGTGFINRPDEIWSLFNFLDKRTFNNYWRFRREFCYEEGDGDEYHVDSGYTKVGGIKPEKVTEFRNLVRGFGPRRELKDVMPDIERPQFMRVDVDLNATQRRHFNEIAAWMETETKGGTLVTPGALAALQRLRMVTVATPEVISDEWDPKEGRRVIKIKLTEPSTKLDAAMEIIEGLEWSIDKKQQVVVFSCFKDPLELLEERLLEADIPHLHMKAGHNDQERFKMWSEDWPKKEHRIFMSTLALGGESINLSSAQYVIFLDRSWSPKDNNQAIGRVVRPGQTGKPVIINIEAIGTTDSVVEEKVNLKESWFQTIFGKEPSYKSEDDKLLESLGLV
jgi:SNF2 family DNA or RNA helicase